MQRQQDGLVPIGEVVGGLGGPLKELREASPQAVHHFTQADQVNQLVGASEADPDRGFMARMMALCSLPRTNPGDRKEYKRVNGPYTLYMIAGGGNKLPFGNFPRLILAWVCTETVRTQSRVLILGDSLANSILSPNCPALPLRRPMDRRSSLSRSGFESFVTAMGWLGRGRLGSARHGRASH